MLTQLLRDNQKKNCPVSSDRLGLVLVDKPILGSLGKTLVR